MHSRPFGCLTKIDAKRADQVRSCHEVATEFFATNAPDPTHWTLNRRFGVFRTIWVHSRPFGYLTKIDAKRAEQVRSCHEVATEFFTTNAPDPTHWTLN